MSWTQGLELLLWVGTAALVLLSVIVAFVLRMRGSRRAARRIALAVGAWLLLYGAALLTVSLTSEERVLARGETKWFCGVYLDCHVGVAVDDVRTADAIGDGAESVRARGRFWIVTLSIRSSAQRARLRLYDADARVRDAGGRSWARDLAAERVLAGEAVDLGRELRPGGSYTVRLVFDIPADVPDPRLLVTDRPMPGRFAERVLIGDDESLFHPRTTLRIS
jgi:hypothetical protein